MNTPMRWLAPAVLLTLFVACTERACLSQPVAVCDRGTCARTEQRVDASGVESTVTVPNQPH